MRRRCLTAVQATGRIIKWLKIIRSGLLMLRHHQMGLLEKKEAFDAAKYLEVFRTFLDAQNEFWQPIADDFETISLDDDGLRQLAEREKGILSSSRLSTVLSKIREAKDNNMHVWSSSSASGQTILSATAHIIAKIVTAAEADNAVFDSFFVLDAHFFPLEFSSGIHELDEIEVVRISPRDAQTGLSALEAKAKVTGDELAHFAAFFRRDWRSNDILWGRIDTYCRIIQALLDTSALEILHERLPEIKDLVTGDYLTKILPRCPQGYRDDLAETFHAFTADLSNVTKKEDLNNACGPSFQKFKEMLILAAQQEAVQQDLPGLYEDLYFQEIKWGRYDEARFKPEANPVALQDEAISFATQTLLKDRINCGDRFKGMGYGTQTVIGPDAAVPRAILGEYATQAYLVLWNMLGNAIGGRTRSFFNKFHFRLFFRHPILFIHHMLVTMRSEPNLFKRLYTLSIVILITVAITILFLPVGKVGAVLILLAALGLLAIFNWFCKNGRSSKTTKPKPSAD